MDDVPVTPAQVKTLECSGWYGTFVWSLDKRTSQIVPARHREQALRVMNKRIIAPFMDRIFRYLLTEQAGVEVDPESLSADWSLETIGYEHDCYGSFIWQVSEGFWNSIPESERDMLFDLAKLRIDAFMHDEVLQPLMRFAARHLA